MTTVFWQDRLFMWEAAAVIGLVGIAWIKGRPQYGSIWGLQLRVAMKSESNWRELHRRVGWLAVAQAAWLALPFPNATLTGLVQLPAALFGTLVAVVLIKRDMEKKP